MINESFLIRAFWLLGDRLKNLRLIAKKRLDFSPDKKLHYFLIAKINQIALRLRGSRAHQPPIQTKMIAESKDFKTITLRGLEEKKNLVEIMNKVMQVQGLKTGQSVIEFIISDYAQKLEELEHVKAKRNAENQNYYQWRGQKEEEVAKLSNVIKVVKNAFSLLDKIEV